MKLHVICQAGLSDPHEDYDACHCHRCSTLDVIIECQVLVLVLLQQTESIAIGKVLKLHQGALTKPTGSKHIHVINSRSGRYASDLH